MREILFRGKRCDNGEWVKGNFCRSAFSATCVQPLGLLSCYDVDPKTVGQFTGLTDKNDKKIFEGDIVDCWSEGVNAKGTVQQRKDGLWIIYPAWQKHIMWGLCPNEDGSTDVEIIGNIHDNPELLEVTGNDC